MSFDSAAPGTSADSWSSDGRLDQLTEFDLARFSRVVVVAAHPDDETLGAGGLMAETALLGLPLSVVIVTDGGASHPASASMTRADLCKLRAVEATIAIRRLSLSADVAFLEFPDGEVRELRDAVRERVSRELGALDARTLVVAPWRGDGHRDHRVVGEVCADIVATSDATLIEYPVWMWHWASPDDTEVPWDSLVGFTPDLHSLAAKSHAIAAYTSQVLGSGAGDEAMLSPEFLRHFARPREVFVTARSSARDTEGSESIGPEYFERLYARHNDPWRFTTRWYESRKRAVTLASLPEERYGSALEIGCSIGVLTEQLARRCDLVTAIDVSAAAVASARVRLAEHPNVTVRVADAATSLPDGRFDLIVLSEVGYYFSPDDLDAVLTGLLARLAPGGTVLACHWRHTVEDYLATGDQVHSRIAEKLRMPRLVHHEEEDFVLDVYSPDGRSVAGRTGLL